MSQSMFSGHRVDIRTVVIALSVVFMGVPGVPAQADSDAVAGSDTRIEPAVSPPATEQRRPEPRAEKDIAKPAESPAIEADAAGIRASNVTAAYTINWLGSNVGSFNIKTSISNRQYAAQATANVSVFFGSFTWQGVTSSKGLMTANGPVPQNYAFRYATGEKRESVELRFVQRMVRDISINPPARAGGSHVPLTATHLQNVVDPLSAVIMMAQARSAKPGENPCNRRMPIFDGRVRYDLTLSPKGTRQIGNSGKLRGTAYVCSVRYTQIAGHKAGKSDADYATGNTGIEIWLVPLPEAGLVAPYHVTVPTPAGTATMTAVRFDVEKQSGRQAAVNKE